jgi:hypothetical protein
VPPLPVILAALALVALGSALTLRRPAVLPFVLVILAAEYLTAEAVRWPAIDPATPLYAGGLLILAETASWSLEPHWPSRADPDMGRRRALRLAGMAFGAIALDRALLWVAAVPVASGLVLTAVGVVAATGSLALVAVLARRA